MSRLLLLLVLSPFIAFSCLAGEQSTVAHNTGDIPKDRFSDWNRVRENAAGYYHFEYGDGGGSIILSSYLPQADQEGEDLSILGIEDLRYNGVIFAPASILSKQTITVLDNLRAQDSYLVDEDGTVVLRFGRFTEDGEEISGIIYDAKFFAQDR